MTKRKVLVVEDEKAINDLISINLRKENCEVDQVYDGDEAIQKIINGSYDLVVLDWMLPQSSGIEILGRIKSAKAEKGFGILMVTAKVQNEDIILGLDSGADDYITKPFDLSVLKARVNAIMRRFTKKSGVAPAVLALGGLSLNSDTHEVSCNNDKIELTVSEFKLLRAMLLNPGKVMTRKQLVSEVQGEGVVVVDRSIDTHMVGLRKKLGNCSELIETVRGVGYRAQQT